MNCSLCKTGQGDGHRAEAIWAGSSGKRLKKGRRTDRGRHYLGIITFSKQKGRRKH